jgi:hypothetical protein
VSYYSNLQEFIIIELALGILFGLIVAGMSTFVVYKNIPEFNLKAGETILQKGPAKHFSAIYGTTGWLFLTNQRLFFKSHSYALQHHELSFAVKEIENVEPVAVNWPFKNGLLLETKKNKDNKFVVEDWNAWYQSITAQLSK